MYNRCPAANMKGVTPILVVGELINGTRKTVREAIINHNEKFIQDLARQQAEAGADYIDVNVATGHGNREPADMEWAVELIQQVVDLPLAIDSTNREAMEIGLKTCRKTPMLNSVSAEPGRLEPFLDLAAKYKTPVVALPIKNSGIPPSAGERLEVCKLITEEAAARNIAAENIYFDPLVLPLGVDSANPSITLETIRKVKNEIPGAKTLVGLSNVSYGLPQRKLLNRIFLVLCDQAGLDAALLNPADRQIMAVLKAAEALLGKDNMCMKYLRAYRQGLLND